MLLMLVWPFIVPGIWMFFLFYYQNFSRIFLFLFMLSWSYYSYFMLTVMRNSNLQALAVDFCDFEAYLECMKFLEKFYLNGSAVMAQKVNSTDAYIIRGDFDGAYQNLMRLHDKVQSFSMQTRMMYDYFWCRFYAELEDVDQFQLCIQHYKETWINVSDLPKSVRSRANILMQELYFREMMFQGRIGNVKEYLTNMYLSGNLSSKYEFLKYCYFMGRVEFAMANFSIAKHWFAQTVSFGLQEHMSRKAQLFLNKLEEMRIGYAVEPPKYNVFYPYKKIVRMSHGAISIIIGFVIMILLLMLK